MTHFRAVIKVLLAVPAFLLALFIIFVAALIRPDISVDDLKSNYANEASQFVQIDEMDVHVRDEGAGEAILLIHGTFASLHTWDDWTDSLKHKNRVIRLDLPGFGLTGPNPRNDYSTRATLHLIDSLRHVMDIDQWSIAGNSLGGRIALDYARFFPENTISLILVNAAAGVSPVAEMVKTDTSVSVISQPNPNTSNQRPFLLRALNSSIVRSLMSVVTPRFFFEKTLEGVYADENRIQELVVDRYYDMMRRSGNRKAFLNRGKSAKNIPDYLIELPSAIAMTDIRQPVLILWGEMDTWIPATAGRRLQQILPDAKLIVYPDAGHVPMEEIPERTVIDVQKFLDRLKLK